MFRQILVVVFFFTALMGCGFWPGRQQDVSVGKEPAPKSPPPSTSDAGKVRPECVDLVRAFENALGLLDEDSPVANIAAIRKAELTVGEDPTSCLRGRLDTLYRREREKLVMLAVADTKIRPTLILTCPKLEEGFLCNGNVADESRRAIELEPSPMTIKPGDPIRLTLLESYRPGDLKLYQIASSGGEPQLVERVPVDGALNLGEPMASTRVLFSLVQEPGGYVKYVWVVRIQP